MLSALILARSQLHVFKLTCLEVLLSVVGIPHLATGSDGCRHRVVDDDVAGHVQVRDALSRLASKSSSESRLLVMYISCILRYIYLKPKAAIIVFRK